MTEVNANKVGTLTLGEKTFSRLGYGAMQLPGKCVWGALREP
jgi:pyridoxine 4-dehydrogenase